MSDRENLTAEVIIIGAGIAGLTAANELESAGKRVTVIDKGRSVGGRLATRRVGPGVADHGAQFFTVREAEFQEKVDNWVRSGLVFEWSKGFSDGSLLAEPAEGNPRYATRGGMNALAKRIAEPLQDVRVNTRIVTATCDEKGWIFQDSEGDIYTSNALIITAPVPQSMAILDAGATALSDKDFEQLARITYAECLCGLFWVEGRATLPSPGAIQRRNANVIWVGDNQQKGISKDATLITLQAGEQFSRQMWTAPDERILNSLQTELQIFITDDTEIKERQLKRWRYSRPLVTYPDRYMHAQAEAPLLLAGDAFGGPRVEGAYLSGLYTGKKMVEMLG
ncbi:MAG: FAD-dependent oxidoreductase [Anaerolineaceae bacterium]|nr:MAG: FAD-dependent oxidoreductase [Anaerolineaceae bacterium]